MKKPSIEATYLGDGVYAEFDGHGIWIFTERENGWHSIFFERDVYVALVKFSKTIFGKIE